MEMEDQSIKYIQRTEEYVSNSSGEMCYVNESEAALEGNREGDVLLDAILPATGEAGSFTIEYIDSSAEEAEVVLRRATQRHTVLTQSCDGHEYYRCEQCYLDYASIDEFISSHKYNGASDDDVSMEMAEAMWEVVDDDATPCPIGAIKIEGAESNTNDFFNNDDNLEFLQETKEEIEELHEDEAVFSITQIAPAETDAQTNEQNEDKIGDAKYGEEEEYASIDKRSSKRKDQYFCCECQRVFANFQSADQHDCPAAIDREDKIGGGKSDSDKDEQSDSNTKDEFKCAVCNRTFNTVNALNSHSRMHKSRSRNMNNQAVATCDICNTKFSSKKNLLFHMRIHRDRPSKSIEEALPVGALLQYSELDQFFCELCQKSFDQNLLLVHKNMHEQLASYTCQFCNRQFENLSSYEMHVRVHQHHQTPILEPGSTGLNVKLPPPYRPGGRPTTKNGGGKGQAKTHGSNGKMRFPCQYCGHEFARPYEKVKHERCHTGEKPYECEVCGKTFRVSYSLTLHLRTHTNIRPYVCAVCNKRFKSQPVYTTHLKTHETERAYKCEQCPKTFRTAVQLSGHRKSHTKPFSCPECNRPFAALYDVRLHMRTHAKAETKKSSSTSTITSQANNHNVGGGKTGESFKYRCVFCGAVYARLFALRLHIKNLHSQEAETHQTLIMYTETENNNNDDYDDEVRSDEEEDAVKDQSREEDDADAVLIVAAAEAENNSSLPRSGTPVRILRSVAATSSKRRRSTYRKTVVDEPERSESEKVLPHDEIDFHAEEIVHDDNVGVVEEMAIDEDGTDTYDWLENSTSSILNEN